MDNPTQPSSHLHSGHGPPSQQNSTSQGFLPNQQSYAPYAPQYWQHPHYGTSQQPVMAPYNPYHTFSAYAGPPASSTTSTPAPTSIAHPRAYLGQLCLSDSTAATVNTPVQPAASTSTTFNIAAPAVPARKRKRATDTNSASRKRTNTAVSDENQAPAIYGVGPQADITSTSSASLSATHPALPQRDPITFDSIIPRKTNVSGAEASDIWFFVRGLATPEKPDLAPGPEPSSRRQPDRKKYSYLLCRLCTYEDWQTWKNGEGQTTTIRAHLLKHHRGVWEDMVITEKLKNWESVRQVQLDRAHREMAGMSSDESFTLEGFLERLIRWVAADDQSVNTVEIPEFREFILYACQYISDKDLPHRTRLSTLIELQFEKEYKQLLVDLKNSLGCISFTSDIWSRQNLQSFMGVTAHFIAKSTSGTLTLETRLIAFRGLDGSHTGPNLAKEFLRILREIECLNKISMCTLDNAKNNHAMMREMEHELRGMNIPFDMNQNRVRCFPHVVNLAVKDGLKHITALPIDTPEAAIYDAQFLQDIHSPSSLPLPPVDADYMSILEEDPVGKVRRFVNAVRASDQRKKSFARILCAGNIAGGWDCSDGTRKALPNKGLVNDVETRWGSTFVMIDRFVELYKVSEKLISEDDDLAEYEFFDSELRVIKDIREFLLVFFNIQKCVSAEKTPTLSIVLPLYEKTITMLKNLKQRLPRIAHAIDASIKKLDTYLKISRGARIYALAMVLNPSIKFQWIEDNWSGDEAKTARTSIIDSLLEYEKAERRVAHTLQVPSRKLVKAATEPCIEQDSAYDELERMEQDLTRSQSLPDVNTSEINAAEQARRADIDARERVKDELRRYEEDGIHKTCAMHNLLLFWQVNASRYPLLHKAAMDVLPVQASAVPCERVFSSSKETDTNRRSNLSPTQMERLQIMKFGYRCQRLSFTRELLCPETQTSVIDIPAETMRDLLERGEAAKLEELVAQSWDQWKQKAVVDNL